MIRAPWSAVADRLSRPGVGDALELSALCATASTILALTLGIPLGWLLANDRIPGRSLLRAVVLVPLLPWFDRKWPRYALTGVLIALFLAFVLLPILVLGVPMQLAPFLVAFVPCAIIAYLVAFLVPSERMGTL